jgi:outer membrane lipoprotein SlyB
MRSHAYLVAALGLALAGCATTPTGPNVMVLPGSSKSFDAFRIDDAQCRDFAMGQIGASPARAGADRTAVGAAIGTGLGAAAGAAIGAAGGEAPAGAAIGAGTGLLLGSAAGASHGYGVGLSLQHRYDMAYMQCMYAEGHQIPGAWGAVSAAPPEPPPRARHIPPPPAGRPPPPPPDAD